MRWLRRSLPDPLTHWERVYATHSGETLSWFQARPATSLALIEEAGLAPDAALLDVGGGDSRLVDSLLDRGCSDLTVLDMSARALERSRVRLRDRAGEVEWIAADVTQWRPARLYDLWHDRAVFHFLTDPADRGRYASTLRHALRPGGQAIVATFARRGPRRCSGLPVRRYSAATLAAELGSGLALVGSREEVHHTPSGHRQLFIYARFERRD